MLGPVAGFPFTAVLINLQGVGTETGSQSKPLYRSAGLCMGLINIAGQCFKYVISLSGTTFPIVPYLHTSLLDAVTDW